MHPIDTGHTDTVASLSLSPAGTHLLSSALDNTVRVWDVRPFAPPPAPGVKTHPRLVRTLTGMPSGFEHLLLKAAWSPDGEWAETLTKMGAAYWAVTGEELQA